MASSIDTAASKPRSVWQTCVAIAIVFAVWPLTLIILSTMGGHLGAAAQAPAARVTGQGLMIVLTVFGIAAAGRISRRLLPNHAPKIVFIVFALAKFALLLLAIQFWVTGLTTGTLQNVLDLLVYIAGIAAAYWQFWPHDQGRSSGHNR